MQMPIQAAGRQILHLPVRPSLREICDERNTIARRMNKYDKQHNKNVEAVGRQIDRIYKEAVNEASLIGVSLDVDTDKPFTFDDYPQTKERINKMLRKLRDKTEVCIVNGINSEWTLANNKCDELANVVFGKNKSKLSQAEYRRYYSTNDDARKAFIVRKDYGLSLSDRVWRYSNEFKTEIEMGLDLGIRNGLSADEMSRELRQYLQHPNMLFRRVRDEHGILHLSQRAKQFHFGRGVYRSSYLNARRLAATETNIAYRTADHDRWKQMDFVVGIEVHLSGNHTCKGRDGKPHEFTDICDQLKGRYPKDFKFTGWHPHCRCYATTILKTPKEMRRDTQKILNGQPTDTESVNAVNDTPQGFKDWMLDSQDRIKGAVSLPYFIIDNPIWSNIGANKQAKFVQINTAVQRTDKRTEKQSEDILRRWYTRKLDRLYDAIQSGSLPVSSRNALNEIDDSILLGDYDDAKRRIGLLEAAIRRHQTRTEEQKADIIERVKSRGKTDNPNKALKGGVGTVDGINKAFKKINAELKEKWFEHGDLNLKVTVDEDINGQTDVKGTIWLKKDRLEGVKAALNKIRKAESNTITEKEADAMATFWHEITHNRTKKGMVKMAKDARNYMELANEFVARKTLPLFYEVLGCAKTPFSKFMVSRNSTGYNTMVTNYQHVITKLGLDEAKVLSAVQKNLFENNYDWQLNGLVKGLESGGIKRKDGEILLTSDITKLVIACSDGYSKATLDSMMKEMGLI